MGSSNSRLGSSSSRPRVNHGTKRRPLSSFLICGGSGGGGGGSTSNNAPTIHDMDDYPAELLACSDEGGNLVGVNECQSSLKERCPIFCSETECSHSTDATSSEYNNDIAEPFSTQTRSGSVETSNDKQCLSDSREIVSDPLSYAHHSVVPHFERTNEIGSSSSVEQESSQLVSIGDNCDVVEVDTRNGGSQTLLQMSSSSSPDEEVGYSRETRLSSIDNLADSSPGIQASVSPLPSATNSSSSPHLGNDDTQEAASLSPGFLMLDRTRERNDGGVLHVDVVSISSSTLFRSNGEVSSHEARRNSRRLFWDAFSRRSSRRHSDSRTLVFSTDDTDDLGSHDRWLLDFSGDLFEDGLGGNSGTPSSRNRDAHGARWHSRSEIWERFRGGLDESSRRTAFCASGLHPDGTCSCESFLTSEESSTRGSISRIVMLAEALFEVLDEIHRQPISLSLSMVSHPAPESVVNSFPIKFHQKSNAAQGADQDVEQCYICLAEYEEGDKIRVLPCQHEYHMSCVDKWLKEIHGVCPLCRGDVCAGLADGSISSA